ncbi:hypothetical protein BH11PSE8_BH11PSE8_06370 [soil metagenome]
MKRNLVILTHGWTGSSVFAGLFGKAGCWLGSETMRKPDYDTHENAGLVGLNRTLLRALSPGLNHEHRFDFEDVEAMARRADHIDLQPYRDFVAECSRHSPWLWKDPRLTWTIRAWARVLDLERTAFLVLTRDDLQAWISANTRRHVQSMRFTKDYNHGITESNVRFLQDRGLPFLQTSFEDLLMTPEATLGRLNRFFGTELSLPHLQSVCKEPLYRKSRGWRDLALASLIYAKNFGERDGRERSASRGMPPAI